MKKFIIILLLLFACEDIETSNVYYPENGKYGINILGSEINFKSRTVYSFTVQTIIPVRIEIITPNAPQIAIGDIEWDYYMRNDDIIFKTSYDAELRMMFIGGGRAVIKYFHQDSLNMKKEIIWN